MTILPFIVGLALAPAVAMFAHLVGLDRDRAFYPTMLIVVASYYLLFGVLGQDPSILALEAIGFIVFASAAAVGFRVSYWIVAAGLFLHGVFDAAHASLVANDGVPIWWPGFCGSFDVAAALCAIFYIRASRRVFTVGEELDEGIRVSIDDAMGLESAT